MWWFTKPDASKWSIFLTGWSNLIASLALVMNGRNCRPKAIDFQVEEGRILKRFNAPRKGRESQQSRHSPLAPGVWAR